MDDPVATARLAAVAERAARAGGRLLADRFRTGAVEGEFGTDDVKATVDREAERRVLAVLREAYPEHAIDAEESGREPGEEYEWLVDPLDGTNNFASGLPTFATAVTACRDEDPVVTAVHEPLPDTLYLARRGQGASVNGDPLRADSDLPLERGTVSLIVGLEAVRDPERLATARDVESALAERCKRVHTTWAPVVDWGLVAGGAMEGVVCLHPDRYEHRAGRLLAAESGVATTESGPVYVGAGDPDVRDELAAVVDATR